MIWGWIIVGGIVLFIIVVIANSKEGSVGKRFIKKLKDCCKHRKW